MLIRCDPPLGLESLNQIKTPNSAGAEQSQQEAQPLSVRSKTKLNLTTVYATYAGPKHFSASAGMYSRIVICKPTPIRRTF
jgi:hypothetical protein